MLTVFKSKKFWWSGLIAVGLIISVVLIWYAYIFVYENDYNPIAENLLPIKIVSSTPVGEFTTDIKVPILMYHYIRVPKKSDYYAVSPEVFLAQMQWLKDSGFTVIKFSDFYNALISSSTLPVKAVVISFDDGYRTQYENAFPVLKQFGYPAIFYPYTRDIGVGKRDYMTWEMLKDLQIAGMEIGSHSVNHRHMNKINEESLIYETQISKKVLEEKLGIPIQHFSYPFGLYNEKVVRAVKNTGYLSAVTIRPQISDRKDGAYFIARIRIDNSLDSLTNRLKNL